MKKSEEIKEKANSEENDLKAMGLYNKALREKRSEKFEDYWLEKLKEKTQVTFRENGSYTFDSHLGIIDFFPKANNLLIRKTGKWKKPGLKFIIQKILNL
jgi:hypothetical protein